MYKQHPKTVQEKESKQLCLCVSRTQVSQHSVHKLEVSSKKLCWGGEKSVKKDR